jgi:hypothetical protein
MAEGSVDGVRGASWRYVCSQQIMGTKSLIINEEKRISENEADEGDM